MKVTQKQILAAFARGEIVLVTLACCDEDKGVCFGSQHFRGVHAEGCKLAHIRAATFQVTAVKGNKADLISPYFEEEVYKGVPLTGLQDYYIGAPL